MSKVRLLLVPHDSGLRDWRMGNGPDRLLDGGLTPRLRAAGHSVSKERIQLPAGTSGPEIQATFTLAADLAERVRAARRDGVLPVVLAGNCASAIGTLAGLGDADPAVVWLDAHADLNTPETTRTGMLDGMALSIVTGRCWTAVAGTVPGFRAIPDARVCLMGTRNVDPAEADLLRSAAIPVLAADELAARLSPTLDALRARTATAYLHIDLDVLDQAEGIANQFAAPDGLRLGQVRQVVDAVCERFQIGAVALTAYDPSRDRDGRICAAAHEIVAAVADGAFRG